MIKKNIILYTVCPRSSNPFHIVTCYIKWVTTQTVDIDGYIDRVRVRKRKRERKKEKEWEGNRERERKKERERERKKEREKENEREKRE